MTDTDRREIQALITSTNLAWRHGRGDELRERLHAEVAFAGPDLGVVVEGREACLRSYEEFSKAAVVHRFEESPAVVRVTADTAVAIYQWSIAYSLGGTRYEEAGRELLVCVRTNGRWQLVWRAQFPSTGA